MGKGAGHPIRSPGISREDELSAQEVLLFQIGITGLDVVGTLVETPRSIPLAFARTSEIQREDRISPIDVLGGDARDVAIAEIMETMGQENEAFCRGGIVEITRQFIAVGNESMLRTNVQVIEIFRLTRMYPTLFPSRFRWERPLRRWYQERRKAR